MINQNKNIFCSPNDNIRVIIKKINKNKKKFCIVLSKDKTFQGIVTDGDIRRSIMKHNTMQLIAKNVMNSDPIVSYNEKPQINEIKKIRKLNSNFLVHLNKKKKFKNITFLNDFNPKKKNNHKIIIMAGGKGTRLKYLTKNKPKALVKINENTIIENIILKLKKNGFFEFIISVGHLSEKIKKFLKDGKKLGVNIEYINESKPLGTCGSLSLLKKKIKKTFVVINCDIITNMNFENLLDFHKKNRSLATMSIVEKEFQNIYGVVKTKKEKFLDIEEKPIVKFFVNAGIYVFEPKILNLFKINEKINMNDLFLKLKKKNFRNFVYPIVEDWYDVGNLKDFHMFKKKSKQQQKF